MTMLSGTNPYVQIDDDRLTVPFRKYPKEVLAELENVPRPELLNKLKEFDEELVKALMSVHSSRCHSPEKDLKFDLRCLPMHLHVKVQDVLGCAEEMWEWVVEYQRRLASATTTASCVARLYHELLVNMSKAEFDECVARFELYVPSPSVWFFCFLQKRHKVLFLRV